MVDKKIRLKQQKQDGTYDYLFPATKSSIVDVNGKTLDTALAETDKKIIENNENFTAQLAQNKSDLTELIYDSGHPIYPDMTPSEIQQHVDGGGLFIFNSGVYYIDTLSIPSDTTLISNGAILTTTNEQPFALRTNDNASNIEITGFEITGENSYQVGVGVGLNNQNVHIHNNHIHDLRNETNKQVLGIIVPSLSCYDILIENNHIENLHSVEDGSIGTSFGGWCKGITVTVGLELYEYDYSAITDDNITKRVVIRNNHIEGIYPEEDGDGIHIDVPFVLGSTVQNWKLDHLIEGNFLKDCAKRFFKIMVAGGVTLRNNTGVHTLNTGLRSCISEYSKNFIVEDNKFYNRGDGYIRYGVDFGLDEVKYTFSRSGKGVIKNNFFELGADDHTTGKQSFGITFNDAELGYYNTVIIEGNYIQCGYKPLFFPYRTEITDKQDGMIALLEINDNIIETGASTIHNIEIGLPTDRLLIKNNTFKSEEGSNPRSNPILIYTNSTTILNKHVIFAGNYLGYAVTTLQFKDTEHLMLSNNIVNNVTSAGIATTNVTHKHLSNNYGIFNQGIFA